jgi:cysteine desulfurase/selenocysteine lyase
VARFFGAKPQDIALTCSATGAMASLAAALPLRPGAVVAISRHEPPSSLIPWVGLARTGRVQLRPFVPALPWNSWRGLLDDAEALVISHVLPTSGEILPLEEICKQARRRDTWVIANGSHAAGIVPVDLQELGVDAYVATGSGFLLGPRGTAWLYVRDKLRSKLVPAARRVEGLESAPEPQAEGIDVAAELELEERDPSRAAGLVASLEWLGALGLDVVREHATILAQHLYEGMRHIAGIEMLSSADSVTRCPIVGIRVTKRPYTQVTQWLREELSVRVHPVATPGLNSIRATPHLVNRKSDLEALIEGMRRLAYV